MQTTVMAPSAAGFFAGAGAATGCGAGAAAGFGACAATTGGGAGAAVCALTGGVAAAVVAGGGAGSGAAAVCTGGAVTAAGGAPGGSGGGVTEEPGCADAMALNAERAELNGPGLPAAAVAGPAERSAAGVPELVGFGAGGALVDETIAITTPAMSNAMEQESAATIYIGGRRLLCCAVIVRLS